MEKQKRKRRLFTEKEQEQLRSNPYTLSVDSRFIRFTLEFKELVVEELKKPGMNFPKILRNANYDPKLLGKGRVDAILRRIRMEAASPRGLFETGPSRESILAKDLSRKRTETSIRLLQEHIARLEQEISILKKISLLNAKNNLIQKKDTR